jgi:hypothetical protein
VDGNRLKKAKMLSAAQFEGNYEENGETAPDIPWISPVSAYPENPPIEHTLNEFYLERREPRNLATWQISLIWTR